MSRSVVNIGFANFGLKSQLIKSWLNITLDFTYYFICLSVIYVFIYQIGYLRNDPFMDVL